MTEVFYTYAIYACNGGYVAKRWAVSSDSPEPEMDHSYEFKHMYIEIVRSEMQRKGLVKLIPMPDDDKSIIETWI